MDESGAETGANTDHESQVEEKNNQQQQIGKENRIQEADDTEKTCFACKRSLAKSPQLINLAGQAHKWHPECFRCHICRQPMDALDSCHLYKEKILCRSDYLRLRRDNSIKCSRCRWQINASDWVRRAGQDYVYHLACFNCDICSRQLNTGDQFAIDVQQRGRQVRLLCRLHFSIDSSQAHLDDRDRQQQHLSDSCKTAAAAISSDDEPAGGGVAINHQERRIGGPPSLPSDEHPPYSSITSTYNTNTNQQTFATHASALIMNRKQQYLHLLGPPGAAGPVTCSSSASMNEIISSGGLMSTNTAKKCADDSHSSEQHHRRAISSKASSSSTSSSSSTTSSSSSLNSGINTNNQQQQQQHSLGLSSSKSKRVRTTFTEDQLSILQNHFHIDSNPDGQDLERIATITGLSKRVTQVWFQNSRARQKKYMIKRKPSSSGGGGGGGGGPSEAVMATSLGPNNNQQVLGRQFQQHHQLFDRTPSMLRVGDPATMSVIGAVGSNSDQMGVKVTDEWQPNEASNESDFSNSVEMDLVAESMDESDGQDEDDNHEDDEQKQDDEHRSVDLSPGSNGGPTNELPANIN